MKKRFLSMMLTVMMVLSLVPAVGATEPIDTIVLMINKIMNSEDPALGGEEEYDRGDLVILAGTKVEDAFILNDSDNHFTASLTWGKLKSGIFTKYEEVDAWFGYTQFHPSESYDAKIVLTPKEGYTFNLPDEDNICINLTYPGRDIDQLTLNSDGTLEFVLRIDKVGAPGITSDTTKSEYNGLSIGLPSTTDGAKVKIDCNDFDPALLVQNGWEKWGDNDEFPNDEVESPIDVGTYSYKGQLYVNNKHIFTTELDFTITRCPVYLTVEAESTYGDVVAEGVPDFKITKAVHKDYKDDPDAIDGAGLPDGIDSKEFASIADALSTSDDISELVAYTKQDKSATHKIALTVDDNDVADYNKENVNEQYISNDFANYAFTFGDCTLTVNPLKHEDDENPGIQLPVEDGHAIPYTNTSAVTVSVNDFVEVETVDSIYPKLPTDIVDPRITEIVVNDTNDILAQDDQEDITADKQFALKSGLSEDDLTKTATLTVTIRSDNYKPITATVYISLLDKDDAGLQSFAETITREYGFENDAKKFPLIAELNKEIAGNDDANKNTIADYVANAGNNGQWTWSIASETDAVAGYDMNLTVTEENGVTYIQYDNIGTAVLEGTYSSDTTESKDQKATVTIEITPKELHWSDDETEDPTEDTPDDVNYATNPKIYDATVEVIKENDPEKDSVVISIVSGIVSGDNTVSVTGYDAEYTDPNVGEGNKEIAITNIELDNPNYTIADKTIDDATINPRPVTVTLNASATYGEEDVALNEENGYSCESGISADSDVFGEGEKYEDLGVTPISDNAKSAIASLNTGSYNNEDKLEATASNTNYVVTFVENLTIDKADFTGDDEQTFYVKYNEVEQTINLDAEGLYDLPDNITGITQNSLVEVVRPTNDYDIIDGDTTPDEDALEIDYKLTSGLKEDSVGDSAVITFDIASTNYNDYTITATIILDSKQSLIPVAEPENAVYDGKPHDGFDDDILDESIKDKVDRDDLDITYTDEDGNELPDVPTEVGEYTVTIKIKDDPDVPYTGKDTAIFYITKRDVIVTPTDKSILENEIVPTDFAPLNLKGVALEGESQDDIDALLATNAPVRGDIEPVYSYSGNDYSEYLPKGVYDIKVENLNDIYTADSIKNYNLIPGVAKLDVECPTVTFETGEGTPVDPIPALKGEEINEEETELEDHEFDGWYYDEECTDPVEDDDLITEDITVYAKFTPIKPEDNRFYWSLLHLFSQQFKITADCNEGGIVSPEGVTSVYFDESVDYTITPYEGYEIVSVLIDDVDIGAVEEYTFKRVQEDHTITAVFQEIGWENPFTDVSESAWYYDAVEYVNENGLMLGTNDAGNLFAPDQNLNRATVVTALWRLEGSPIVHAGEDFLDVEPDMWYTQAVRWATSESIVLGFDDNTFRPLDDVTHEQVCAFLHRYAKYKGIDDGMMLGILPQYEYSAWAENDVNWAETYGILNAVPDIFDLTESATRAHFAAYMFQFAGLDEE